MYYHNDSLRFKNCIVDCGSTINTRLGDDRLLWLPIAICIEVLCFYMNNLRGSDPETKCLSY